MQFRCLDATSRRSQGGWARLCACNVYEGVVYRLFWIHHGTRYLDSRHGEDNSHSLCYRLRRTRLSFVREADTERATVWSSGTDNLWDLFFERMKQNDCVAFTQASAPLKALPCLLGGKGQVGGGGGGGGGREVSGDRAGGRGGILWAMLMDSLDSSSLLPPPPPPQHTQPTATQPVPGALLFC